MTAKIAIKPARRFAREPAERSTSSGLPPGATIPSSRPESKIALVARLLERSDGATLDELVEATGWLLHTTRAALTGLKKKGRAITKSKRGEVTCYFIASLLA